MAVNLELGVDMGAFNSGISQAKAQINAFNATLKFAEASFKATGDAEAAMVSKTNALNGKLQTQKRMVEQYAKALEAMKNSGVKETSEEYLKMQRSMILAQAAMNDTQAALNGLNTSQQEAAQSADKLTTSVQGIGRKISLDQVISGIDRITDGMERAAQKVVQFGEKLWATIMDSAKRADDTATMAEMYGIDLQTFKRMQALVAGGLDTSVDAMLSSQDKLKKGIGNGTKAVIESLEELGLAFESGKGANTLITEDTLDLMFRAGQAIMAYGDGVEAEAKQEAQAQALFGKSWKELVPLFKQYNTVEEYRAALNGVSISSEDATKNAAELADRVGLLENTWTSLKDEIIGAVAPGITAGAEALNNVLSTILEYLQKPEGQEMLTKLGESVAGLFDDLANVSPEDVVSNFVTVFDQLTKGLEFLANNWDKVVNGIKEIGIAFGLLKIGEGVLEGLRLINGFKSLLGSGGGSSAVGAAAGIGGKLLATGAGVAVTGASAAVSAGLAGADPTGLLAMTPYLIADQTEFGRVLRDGGSVEEAAKMSGKAVEKAAENAVKAWEDWGTQIVETPKNLAKVVWDWFTGGGKSGDWSGENGDDWSVKVKPEAEAGSAEDLSKQIGAVTVPVNLEIAGFGGSAVGGGGGSGLDPLRQAIFGGMGFANGLPFVQRDGLYLLHKGETVTPAREVNSRSFNSNLYVESMIMNNGTDVNGLASSMAAAQRRTMSGYGS